MRALSMLTSMRRDFNALLSEADNYDPGPRRPQPIGTALDELGPDERLALAQILGLPFEPQYRALFEVKAAEYLEQDQLWNEITEQGGFVDARELATDAPQSAVVLTYSGSLLLVSAPTEKKNFRRRYVYQSIYAGHLPTEGSLGLLEPIYKNRPVAGTRIKTSPVRKMRLSVAHTPEWERQRETFLKLHRTLNGAMTPAVVELKAPPATPSQPRAIGGNTLVDGTPPSARSGDRVSEASPAVRPSSAGIADLGTGNKIPSVFVQVLHSERQRDSVRKAEDAARAELRTLLARLIDGVAQGDYALEAEIIGQVMHLQRLAIERGEMHILPGELSRLETENNDSLAQAKGGLAIGKLGQIAQTIEGAHLGVQAVVRNAPIAVLTKDANLYAVLGNVRSFVRRS